MTTDLDRVERREMAGVDVLRYLGYDPNHVATKALVLLANRYQLDPLLNQIELIPAKGGGVEPYITRDGYLHIAHADGRLDGIVVDEERRNSTNDGWTAYVAVYRKDMTHPFRYGAQCKDSEHQAKAGNGPEMALTRAERRALKRAFDIPGRDDADGDDDAETEAPPPREGSIAVAVSTGSDPAPEEAKRSPAPGTDPHEFVIPTTQQLQTVRGALARTGRPSKPDQLAYIADVLGRPVDDWRDVSRADLERVARALVVPLDAPEEPY